MTIKQTAITLVRATEIFKDFFKRNPDMTNMDDVTELLAIQCDICYAMHNMEMRNEKADQQSAYGESNGNLYVVLTISTFI